MLRILVGVASIAVTLASAIVIYDRATSYLDEIARKQAAADAAARAIETAVKARQCDLDYWEYRRGKATDSVAPERMTALREIIKTCNQTIGADYSL